MVDSSKYFPPNFGTRGAAEVDKLNAMVDALDGFAEEVTDATDAATAAASSATDAATSATDAAASATDSDASAAAAAATLANAAPKDSPAFTTLVDVPQHATSGGPAYAEGRVYYDTTLHKLRIGGAVGYETITSV